MRALWIILGALSIAPSAIAQPLPLSPGQPPLAGSLAARAVNGAQIAAAWCDSCHMVRQSRGSDIAAPFAVIATRRSPDDIRAFLARPHGGMPPISLSNGQIDDILALMRCYDLGSGP
jgi:mono/diheme cytochrome c family protein